MKQIILIDYVFWRVENELFENTEETIKQYISGLYYDLCDNIDRERESFGVPKDLDNVQAIEYIENEIEKMLVKEYIKGE